MSGMGRRDGVVSPYGVPIPNGAGKKLYLCTFILLYGTMNFPCDLNDVLYIAGLSAQFRRS